MCGPGSISARGGGQPLKGNVDAFTVVLRWNVLPDPEGGLPEVGTIGPRHIAETLSAALEGHGGDAVAVDQAAKPSDPVLGSFSLIPSRWKFYGAVYRCEPGIFLACYPHDRGHHACLEVKSEAIEALGPMGMEALRNALRTLAEGGYTLKGTRFDTAFDHVATTPVDVRDAWLAGRVETRVQATSWDWRSNAQGDTFYFGKRSGADCFARCYNRRGFTRLEMELKASAGEYAFLLWLNGQDFVGLSVGLLMSWVRFVDGDGKLVRWQQDINARWPFQPAMPPKSERGKLDSGVYLAARVVEQARQEALTLLTKLAPYAQALGLPVGDMLARVTLDASGQAKASRIAKALDRLGH